MTHNPSCFGVQTVLMEQNIHKVPERDKKGPISGFKNASRKVQKATTLINKTMPTSKGGKRLESF